jgi:hypothetical protein
VPGLGPRQVFDSGGRVVRGLLAAHCVGFLVDLTGSCSPPACPVPWEHHASVCPKATQMFARAAGSDHAAVPELDELRTGFSELLRGMLGE